MNLEQFGNKMVGFNMWYEDKDNYNKEGNGYNEYLRQIFRGVSYLWQTRV